MGGSAQSAAALRDALWTFAAAARRLGDAIAEALDGCATPPVVDAFALLPRMDAATVEGDGWRTVDGAGIYAGMRFKLSADGARLVVCDGPLKSDVPYFIPKSVRPMFRRFLEKFQSGDGDGWVRLRHHGDCCDENGGILRPSQYLGRNPLFGLIERQEVKCKGSRRNRATGAYRIVVANGGLP